MKMIEKSGLYTSGSALSADEMTMLYGGSLMQMIQDAGSFIGHCVGYAAGVVKDAVMAHGDDVVAAGGAASVMAYK